MSTIFLASILMFITENMDNAEKYKTSSMGFFFAYLSVWTLIMNFNLFLKSTLLNKHFQLLIPNFVDNIACSMESLNQSVTWKYFPDLENLGFFP